MLCRILVALCCRRPPTRILHHKPHVLLRRMHAVVQQVRRLVGRQLGINQNATLPGTLTISFIITESQVSILEVIQVIKGRQDSAQPSRFFSTSAHKSSTTTTTTALFSDSFYTSSIPFNQSSRCSSLASSLPPSPWLSVPRPAFPTAVSTKKKRSTIRTDTNYLIRERLQHG